MVMTIFYDFLWSLFPPFILFQGMRTFGIWMNHMINNHNKIQKKNITQVDSNEVVNVELFFWLGSQLSIFMSG